MSEFVFLYRGGERPTSPEQGQQIRACRRESTLPAILWRSPTKID
jgi:hypothetical protein